MDEEKKEKLIEAGWTFGDVEDFLNGTMVTYEEMCQVIIDEWNRLGEPKLEWSDLWDNHTIGAFPALYLSRMYDAAKENCLDGLLLSDTSMAKIFCNIIDSKKKE